MAVKKEITPNAPPPLLALVRRNVSPLLDERPPGALTMRELAEQAGVSTDVMRRQLSDLRDQNILREARLRTAGGHYTFVYWIEQNEGYVGDSVG